MVAVSISTSTDYSGEQNVLIEDQQTALTVNFELDEPAPVGGLKVFVDSNVPQIVNRLDLPGFAFNPTVENINPALFGTSFDNSGFYLTIDEGTTSASFTINVFDNSEPDTFLPETFDGLVEAEFSLVAPDGVEQEDLGDVGNLGDYTINPDATSTTVIFADEESQLTDIPEPPTEPPAEPPTNPEPPASSLPLVSLHTSSDYLIEEEGTVSAHVFNVTGATIPEDGLLVSVSAPNLGEFDLDAISVGDGGEIVNVREDRFDIRLTDFTVLVDLPVAADEETEGLETASFSLEAGNGYEVTSDFSSGEFTLVDTASEIPADALNKSNDILPLAIPIELSESKPTFLTTTIDFDIGNRYQNEDGTYTYIDATEDVDFYSFELKEGDVLSIDADADAQRGEAPENITEFVPNPESGPITAFRIFDAQGNELAGDWLGQGPGELFTSYDGYLEFVAPEDATYYLGVSNLLSGIPNAAAENFGTDGQRFDPFVPGVGNNESYIQDGDDFPAYGEYDLTFTLNPDTVLELPQFSENVANNSNTSDVNDPDSSLPTVSLDFLGFTTDPYTDDVVGSFLTEGTPETNSSLFLTLETEGEIPEEGILVNVNSDNYLRQYVTRRTFQGLPFTPGSELETFLYDDTGRETGFQLRVFEPYTFITLNAQSTGWADIIEPDSDEPEDVNWFIASGEGYNVDGSNNEITATYYDPEQVPEPSVIPEVGISISETELIESEGTVTTINFNMSEPPPEEGVVVQVNGSNAGIFPQFDIFNIEIDGGVFPSPNFDFSNFYFKITEQEATITLPVFEDPFDEGLQSFTFSLENAPHYTILDVDGDVAPPLNLGTVLEAQQDVLQKTDTELRLFDADGNELAANNDGAAPGEDFSRDPYLEYTALEAGTYYVGVSQLGNRNYDPNVESSGSGWTFPEVGVFFGDYELTASLVDGTSNPEPPTNPEEPTTQPVFGSLEGDIIEVAGTSQLLFGGDSDDLIDASISSGGGNHIYGGSGDDTSILGSSDRIIGGAGDDKFFATSGGDNIITGGAGVDQFWIATAEIPDAANTITDFTSGEDVLGIAGLGIGFEDLSITQMEGNTLISGNGSDLAILQGVDSLMADNFAFV